MNKLIYKRLVLFRWWSAGLTAVVCAAVTSCAAPLPDLRPPVEVKTIPVTDIAVEPQRIVDAHNKIRRQLSIPELQWSSQMAAYATEWALFLSNDIGCDLQNRGSIGLPQHRNGFGENLYKHQAVVKTDGSRLLDSIDGERVVFEWARESVDYDYTNNACAPGKSCDHYTQLVWRDSAVVGCGAASCGSRDQIWVCNYDPPGNFYKQRPY